MNLQLKFGWSFVLAPIWLKFDEFFKHVLGIGCLNSCILQFTLNTGYNQWLDVPSWKFDQIDAEIVETTLVVSRFRFLRVWSWISVLRVIILPGTQILKVGSRIFNWSRFRFSSLTISTRKDTTEEIQTKIKRKWLVCYAKSRKNKSCFHYLWIDAC